MAKFPKKEEGLKSADPVPEVVLEAPRSIHVHLVDRNKPDFKFDGFWAGRDVKVVLRTLVRAYRKYQQDMRRAVTPVVSEETVLATSAKGDT